MSSSRIALVTGSSRGIGAATSGKLSDAGYAVCINYKSNENAANSILAGLEARGRNAIAVRADVSNEDDVQRLFSTIDEKRTVPDGSRFDTIQESPYLCVRIRA